MFYLIIFLISLANGLEVDLEWDTSLAIQQKTGISTAMSLLRFTQDTSPPGTEWIPLGWEYGSLRLQHLPNNGTKIQMELTSPPSFKVSLGRQSELTQVQYLPDADTATQVVLETIASPWTGSDGLALDANLPYYFKVEAHHDLLLNRTTYEGLFSTGDHWKYLGSLVLQHPHNQTNTTSVVSSATGEGTSAKERDEEEEEEEEDSDNNTSGAESETDDEEEEKESTTDRRQLQMYQISDAPDDSGSLRDLMREAFGEFLRTEHNHRPRTPQDPLSTTERKLDNGLQYTEVFPFPGLFSGLHRMNDTTTGIRAAVYKKLQLRDRLGQVFSVTQGKAYVYDSTETDNPHVRNYLAANSFLLTI